MASWTVEVVQSARKELRQLDARLKAEALQAIRELAEDPFPEGSIQLRGHPNFYRIRCCRDAFRVVYRVSEKQRKVIVLRLRPRASVFHGL
jgi:mRNA interferase RelE/StbE